MVRSPCRTPETLRHRVRAGERQRAPRVPQGRRDGYPRHRVQDVRQRNLERGAVPRRHDPGDARYLRDHRTRLPGGERQDWTSRRGRDEQRRKRVDLGRKRMGELRRNHRERADAGPGGGRDRVGVELGQSSGCRSSLDPGRQHRVQGVHHELECAHLGVSVRDRDRGDPVALPEAKPSWRRHGSRHGGHLWSGCQHLRLDRCCVGQLQHTGHRDGRVPSAGGGLRLGELRRQGASRLGDDRGTNHLPHVHGPEHLGRDHERRDGNERPLVGGAPHEPVPPNHENPRGGPRDHGECLGRDQVGRIDLHGDRREHVLSEFSRRLGGLRTRVPGRRCPKRCAVHGLQESRGKQLRRRQRIHQG